MSGKRKQAPPTALYIDPKTGKQTQISVGAYNQVQGVGGAVSTSDISSLDRQELSDRLNEALANNTNHSGKWDSALDTANQVSGELQDAIAGTKPKYRYRKYLDKMNALVLDQPGQKQTILSRGDSSGSALGGGTL